MTTWLATQPSVHQTRQSGTTGQQGLGAPGEAKSSSKFQSAFLTRTLSLAADGITHRPSEEAIPQGVKQPVVSSCGYLGPEQFQTLWHRQWLYQPHLYTPFLSSVASTDKRQ